MDQILESYNPTLKPQFLISVFGYKSMGWGGTEQAYMQYHEILPDGKYAEARPMPDSVLQAFGASVANNMNMNYNFHGEIPENLMFYSVKAKDLHMVWHSKPQVVPMFFSDYLKIKNKGYPVPGLIWSIFRNSLKIFAYKQFKGRDTELFDGPFPNVSGGSVCLGSTKVDILGNTFQDIITAWEKGFWESKFSHTGTYANLYRELKGDKFPMQKLKKSNIKASYLWTHSTL